MLVGPAERLEGELAKHDRSGTNIEIVATNEYLVEGEHPAYALRQKRHASIIVATKLVKEGRAAAVVGAGPTGGVVASALQVLGTVEGVARPVVGGPFLGFAPDTIMMDLGGNVDCRPDQLLDFAIVGTVYARKMLNIPNPSVALLSVGAEEGKGNEVVRESYPLFQKSGLNFIGNVEGYDILSGRANVIICDGFVGNILVKFFFAPDTLKYLIKIGRAPKTAIIGELLQVKPIIGMVNGTGLIENLGRVRTKRKAMVKIADMIKEHIDTKKPVRVMVHYSDRIEDGEQLREMVTFRYNCAEVYLTEFTPVMASAIGPVVGLSFYS